MKLPFDASAIPPKLAARAQIDTVHEANKALQAETERWVRKAIERGPGWDVWRSNPKGAELNMGDGTYDQFVITYEFAIVPAGAALGAGVLYRQPELTEGERARLLAGRHDWREDKWEDECGVLDCGHPSCERARA